MKLRRLLSFIRRKREIKARGATGFSQSYNESVSCGEWQNQTSNALANSSCANALAGFYAVHGQSNQHGLLVNVYPDDFLGVNVANTFPIDYVSHVQDLSHINSAYAGYCNSQHSQNYLNEPTPFFRRLRRAYRAFLLSWRLG